LPASVPLNARGIPEPSQLLRIKKSRTRSRRYCGSYPSAGFPAQLRGNRDPGLNVAKRRRWRSDPHHSVAGRPSGRGSGRTTCPSLRPVLLRPAPFRALFFFSSGYRNSYLYTAPSSMRDGRPSHPGIHRRRSRLERIAPLRAGASRRRCVLPGPSDAAAAAARVIAPTDRASVSIPKFA